MEEDGESVTEFLGGGDVVFCGCGVGELSDDVEELFAVVGAGLDAVG